MSHTEVRVCLSVANEDQILVGDFIEVPEGVDAVLDGIDLVDPHGMEIVDSWITPAIDGMLGASSYPPDPSPAWSARQDLPGASPDPGESNVVVLLKRTGAGEADAAALRVTYSIAGEPFTTTGSMGITLTDSCLSD